MFRLIISIPLLCLAAFSYAADFRVSGTIISDVDKEVCPGAAYKIFEAKDTVTPLFFNVTDLDGKFSQTLPEAGKYVFKVQYVGLKEKTLEFQVSDKEPEMNLGDIYLPADGEILSEVVVTAKKKLVQSDGATLTYNVEDDPEASVNSTIEMLRKVPMVTVDAEDNIKVNGDSNFKILVNGKEDPMLTGDVKTILKAMPAATIKKIEVITEPGAKYDAEGTGGILNIVTTGKQSLDGYLANISARVANNGFGGSFYGRGKIDKVTASANVNYMKSIDQGYTMTGNTLLENLTDNENRYQNTDSRSKNNFNYLGANMNFSWEPDTINLFTFQANVGKTSFGQTSHEFISMKNIEMVQLWMVNRDNYSKNSNLWVGANASYQHTFHRAGHHLVGSYIFGYGNAESDQTTYTFDENDYYQDYPWRWQDNYGNDYRHTLQFDYVNPINEKNTIEAGLKGNWRKNNSKNNPYYGQSQSDMALNEAERSDVTQFQDIMAAYFSYTGNFGKWNMRAGLRYEYTRMGLDYIVGDHPDFTTKLNDVVPNLAVSYRIKDASNLRLAYQMRISRPSISELNPYRNTMQINQVSYGNPDLDSERSNSLSLTYSNYGGKIGGSLGFSYDRVDNMITDYSFMQDNILNNTYANIGHRQDFRTNLNIQWSVIPMLNIGAFISGRYTDLKADTPQLKAKNSGWTGNFNLNVDYTFPFKLRLSAYGGGGTGWIDLQSKGGGFSYYGLSMSRSFLKNDMMTITAYGSNFFTPYRSFHNTTKSDTFYSKTDFRFRQWSAGLSITFKFGALHTDVKRTSAELDMIEGSSAPSDGGAGGGMSGGM